MSNKKKTSSTTTQQQTESSQSQGMAQTRADVPDWLLQPAQNLAGGLGSLMGQGAGAFTPQTTDLQKQAYGAASNLTNPAYKGAYESLDGISRAADVSGESVLSGLENYYNPFKDQITNPVLADYDAQAGETRAGQAADAARNRAFQGSRYGLQEGATEGQLARGRAATEGGLLKDMYGQAASMSEADAGRRQQASLANQASANAYNQTLLGKSQQQAALRNGIQENSRANAAAQLGAGNAQFAQEAAIKQYPLEYQQQLEGLFQGLNPEMFSGQTVNTTDSSTGQMSGTSTGKTTQKGGFLDSLGQIAKIAATVAPIAMSDRRVKVDIRTEGYDDKGRRWVTFGYIWEPLKRHFGVIAQEILKTDPEAVIVGPNALLMVDYGRLA